MNSNQLKIIAIIGMVLDHVAWVLFPSMSIFHAIGKITFPIFCYMITEGYFKTRNKRNYLLRILGIAIISQIPFMITFKLAFGENFSGLNTIFNLALGLIGIWIYDRARFRGRFIIIIGIAILALFLRTDGDIYGIMMVYIFYKYHDNFRKMAKRVVILTLIYTLAFPIYGIVGTLVMKIMPLKEVIEFIIQPQYWMSVLTSILLELSGLLALVLIKFYNGERGRNLKALFYSFYPVHLIIIYLIKVYLMK